jgi:dTDP-glucose pyrophosphorylase
MSNTTLLIMAAGMGSRFGGLKQIAPVGPNGEIILDFSVYDAKEAGFSKAVFIIKKEIEKDFREVVGKRIEKMMDVDYAFQELEKIPAPFTIPEGRVKPWGTSHAVLCARDKVSTPFAVINADDYYGKSAFKVINSHLVSSKEICMVAYKLENTLTDNGTVSRGVCEVKDGYLVSVTEHAAIAKENDFPKGTVVSMNMWGFMPSIFDELEKGLVQFLKAKGTELKSEYLLPLTVDEMLKSGKAKVKALTSDDKWYGVTYKEDTPIVKAAIARLLSNGSYDNI